MQLNIRALNAKRKVSPTHDQLSSSDYYVTMTISRDQTASSDDVAFTCTSNQKKVFITKSTVSLIPSIIYISFLPSHLSFLATVKLILGWLI